jgi:conjugal transfer pilin signal peptidase TrbI
MKFVNIPIIFSLVICLILLWKGFGIRYNHSDSLPNKIYFSMPPNLIERGNLVDFQLSNSSAVFAKVVAGIPGDQISILRNTVYVNDQRIGDVLDFREPTAEGMIPSGFFFMQGTHPESFDSRYAEFGLVPQNAIRDKLWPIF